MTSCPLDGKNVTSKASPAAGSTAETNSVSSGCATPAALPLRHTRSLESWRSHDVEACVLSRQSTSGSSRGNTAAADTRSMMVAAPMAALANNFCTWLVEEATSGHMQKIPTSISFDFV